MLEPGSYDLKWLHTKTTKDAFGKTEDNRHIHGEGHLEYHTHTHSVGGVMETQIYFDGRNWSDTPPATGRAVLKWMYDVVEPYQPHRKFIRFTGVFTTKPGHRKEIISRRLRHDSCGHNTRT